MFSPRLDKILKLVTHRTARCNWDLCEWCAEVMSASLHSYRSLGKKTKTFRYISSCVAGLTLPVLLWLLETVVFGIKRPCQLP